jgi:hypothetical protein
MKTLDPEGQAGTIELMKPMLDKATGRTYKANDLARAKFDVVPDVGPSSSSRRAATVRALTGVLGMTADPEAQQVLTSMIMMNLEGEGMGEIRAYYRNKLVRMGVIPPTEEEKQEMAAEQQGQQPSAQDQYLMAGAQNQAADAMKKQIEAQLTAAKVEQTHADTIVKLAGIGQAQADHALAVEQHIAQQQAAQQAAEQQMQAAQQDTQPLQQETE